MKLLHVLDSAATLRAHGASELQLARMLGEYPPPHNLMDWARPTVRKPAYVEEEHDPMLWV